MVHESQSLSHPVMGKTGLTSRLGHSPDSRDDDRTGSAKTAPTGESFEQVLSRQPVETQGVRFSAHASQRLAQRKIALSQGDLERISGAADKAAAKGSRESLFLLDKLALIVNVKNRTVLTAIDPERLREGIVTNIDSTVLISGTQDNGRTS